MMSDSEGSAAELSRTKHEPAARRWNYVQEYANAKTEVVEEIIARAVRR